MQAVGKHYSIPVAQIRLWPCEPRDNTTVRPDVPLQGEVLHKTVREMVSVCVVTHCSDLYNC
jgi:hypothetical protein